MFVLRLEDVDITWYHHLLTPLKFERVINHLVLIVLISKPGRKSKTKIKTKSNCAADGSVTFANGFSRWNCNKLALALGFSKLYLARNSSHFINHFLFRYDVKFTAVCKFEIRMNRKFYKAIRVH